jgi:hypothetical protein
VYENANRRLAVWGAVFTVYPRLRIIHRPGRIHSNVDPLSRLPRAPPHESPVLEDCGTIVPDEERQKEAQKLEDRGTFAPAKKAAFVIWWWEDVVDKYTLPVRTRRQTAGEEGEGHKAETEHDGIAAPDQEGMMKAREEGSAAAWANNIVQAMRNLKDPDTPLYRNYKVFEKNLINAFKGGAQVEITQAKIEKLRQEAGTTMEYFILLDMYNNTAGCDETTLI